MVDFHRINLRPELRPRTGRASDDRLVPRGYGPTPMSYHGEVIGQSNQPLYAAARWLLDHGIANAEDEVGTYRGETLSMHGIVGELAKLTVEEAKNGRPTFKLHPWKPFVLGAVGSLAVETPPGGVGVAPTNAGDGLE